MSWLDFFYMSRECEECPSAPKQELVGYAKAFNTNQIFEYGAHCNGKELHYGTEQGKWTEKEVKEFGITDPYLIRKYVGTYKFYDEKYEIDCYWLINNTLEANHYQGLGWGPIASTLFPSTYFCEIEDLSTVAPGDIVYLKNWTEYGAIGRLWGARMRPFMT